LTPGVTYQFKIEARNIYSYSAFSDTLSLKCAFVPDPPLSVTTANLNDQVVVTWGVSDTNGSPITGYKVFV
jgi:hypothetical protein